MVDTARFVIELDGDGTSFRSFMSQFRSTFKSDVADLQATASKLELFGNLQVQVDKARAGVESTRQAVTDLGAEVAKALGGGGKVGDDLAKQLKAAEKAAADASKEYDRQTTKLDALRGSLTKAGVNVSTLALEQSRLAAQIRVAAAAQTDQEAKQVLGIKTMRDVTVEINRAHAAYNTLASGGSLSVKELGAAQEQLRAKVAELRASVTGVAANANAGGAALVKLFSSPLAHALSLAAAGALVERAISESIRAAKEFNQGVAEIGAVTDVSADKLAGLSSEARILARELGLDVNEALRGVLELIRSGLPEDNAIAVLRVAAEASKAAVTDLGTGVKAATLLLDAFGASSDDLPLLFDKIIVGAKNGGATLKQFAENAGPLLSVARAAGVSFDELLATLTVLVDKSGNAEKSVADLTKIIATLDTAGAREKLRELGIEGNSLTGIFQQLGARGLSVGDVLGLQLTAGGAKSAASLAALTKNAGDLPATLDKITNAAGATKTAVDKLFDTPKEREERFNAALKESAINLGNFAGSGSRVAVVATDVLTVLNRLPNSFDGISGKANLAGTAVDNSVSRAIARLFGVEPAAQAAAKSLETVSEAEKQAAADAAATALELTRANQALGEFSKRLLDEVTAINAASAADIAALQTRATNEIEALSKRRDASLETAAATLAIETKLATDRLAIIVKAEAAVNAAVDKAATARETLARRNGENETKIAADAAAARITALAPVLAQYQAHYSALLGQAQQFAAKIEATDRERIDFNQGIERQLFDLRISSLSVFDQYVAKSREADRLVSEARKAAATGDVEAAKQFANQAIGLANSIGEATDKNGTKVVSALDAESVKVRILKGAQDAVNTALDGQAESAKTGAAATKQAIADVVPKLEDLQKRVDDLKATVAKGLKYTVELDEASVTAAQDTIDRLATPRETTLTVHVVQDGALPGGAAPPTPAPGLNAGGLVRKFAAGGPVGKVPGVGSSDTVPALLRAGSFVVRKAASAFYGDNLMGAVVRGYASGGPVFGMNDRSSGTRPIQGTAKPEDVVAYAENKWGFNPFSSAPIAANGFAPSNTASRFFDPGNIGGRSDKGGSAPVTDPKVGRRSGDSEQGNLFGTPFSLDTRPIPEALITAINVISYAREMLNFASQLGGGPLLGSLTPAILSGINTVSRNPTDQTALKSLLQAAETIGANPYLFSMWGKTAGSPAAAQIQPLWFLDWLEKRGAVGPGGAASTSITGGSATGTIAERLLGGNPNGIGGRLLSPTFANDFAKRFFSSAIAKVGPPPKSPVANPPGGGRLFFGDGGASSDTVPAMLTPGEFVVSKPAVDRFGLGLLDAINRMRIPPAAVRNMLSPRAPVARFATGGPVGVGMVGQTATAPPTGTAAGAQVVNNFNFALDSAALVNTERLRPSFVQLMDEYQRRTR